MTASQAASMPAKNGIRLRDGLTSPTKRRRRSLLFMPGDDLRKIEKGPALGADSLVIDLEDGVAMNRKQAARDVTREALRRVVFGRTERLVRLNAPETGLTEEDLRQTVESRPDGYVLPKVESAGAVQALSRKLAEIEHQRGWKDGSIRLLAVVETARGIMQLQSIAESDPRLDALAFGAEDLAGDIGATRTRDGWEVFYARSAVVIAAAANGLQAIDMIFTDLQDVDGLRVEAQRALQMGFAGKMAVHPRQVAIVNDVFMPSEEAAARAEALLRAFEEHQASGTGVFAFEGRMVDMPVVRAARRLLERAAM